MWFSANSFSFFCKDTVDCFEFTVNACLICCYVGKETTSGSCIITQLILIFSSFHNWEQTKKLCFFSRWLSNVLKCIACVKDGCFFANNIREKGTLTPSSGDTLLLIGRIVFVIQIINVHECNSENIFMRWKIVCSIQWGDIQVRYLSIFPQMKIFLPLHE
jgi:hypothetical protein